MASLPRGHIVPTGSVIGSAMPRDLVQSVELKLPVHGATEADKSPRAPETRTRMDMGGNTLTSGPRWSAYQCGCGKLGHAGGNGDLGRIGE
jgi:hypothetical protein